MQRLEHCLLCPRNCGVDRLSDRTAACKTGRWARVSSYFPHLGEEDCLRGWRGSGTIFFSLCNLRCVFCQNFEISQAGARPANLAAATGGDDARAAGHGVPQPQLRHPRARRASDPGGAPARRARRGLRLPLVYNTSAYDSLESLQLMDGIIDVYMPDFKIWDEGLSLRYLKARDYPRRRAVRSWKCTARLERSSWTSTGWPSGESCVRHLVMPGQIGGTEAIMRFVAEQVSPNSYVNVMGQYHPAGKVDEDKYSEINRRTTRQELQRAIQAARRAGLWRFDERRPVPLAAAVL